MEDIIEFMSVHTRSTFDFRDEFGVYPRKNLRILLDSGVAEKIIINRRVHWKLVEGTEIRQADGELEPYQPKDEIKEKFEKFVDEVDSSPVEGTMREALETLTDELNQVTEEVESPIPKKKKFKLFGRNRNGNN
jgi:hypothetical protein